MDRWRWDGTLFRGCAAYYTRGRLPYAPGFAETVAAAVRADGRGRLLDVGCGPGTVSLALAGFFAEVVGLDPDEDMVAEAARQAERHGVGNAHWVVARARGSACRARRVPGGGLRAVLPLDGSWSCRGHRAADAGARRSPRPYQRPEESARRSHAAAAARPSLRADRRAGALVPGSGTASGEGVVLAEAGFEGFERHVVPAGDVVERTVDDIVAWVFSRSDSAPHLFGGRLVEFERDLRREPHRASHEDRFAERPPPTEIRIWRRPRGER